MGTNDQDKQDGTEGVAPPKNEARTIEEFKGAMNYWIDRAHILGAMHIQEIPAMHRIVFGEVWVNPYMDKYGNGPDIYRMVGESVGLRLGVYDRIAAVGGLQFPQDAMALDMDASSLPDRLVIRGCVQFTDLTGHMQVRPANAILDVDTKCDRERSKLAKQTNSDGSPKHTPQAIEAKVYELRLNLRESGVQRAMSVARRDGVKNVYGELRRGWTQEDFERPFIVPALRVALDMSDAQTKTFFLLGAVPGLAKALAFGAGQRGMAGLLGTPVAPAARQIEAGPAATVDTHAPDDDDEVFPEATRAPEQAATAAADDPADAKRKPVISPVGVASKPGPDAFKEPPAVTHRTDLESQPGTTAAAQAPAGAATTTADSAQATQAQAPKPDKAQEWKATFAAGTEAGIPQDQVQPRARSVVAAMGGNGDKSETWTAEQWKAVRDSFKASGELPEEEPAKVVVPETSDAFRKLDVATQNAVLEEMLRTRVLQKPPTKRPSELTDSLRVAWFEKFLTLPLKQEAA